MDYLQGRACSASRGFAMPRYRRTSTSSDARSTANFLFKNSSCEGRVVPSQVDDGELLVTAPRAMRRTVSCDNSPAVRRLVKTVERVTPNCIPSPACGWRTVGNVSCFLASHCSFAPCIILSRTWRTSRTLAFSAALAGTQSSKRWRATLRPSFAPCGESNFSFRSKSPRWIGHSCMAEPPIPRFRSAPTSHRSAANLR